MGFRVAELRNITCGEVNEDGDGDVSASRRRESNAVTTAWAVCWAMEQFGSFMFWATVQKIAVVDLRHDFRSSESERAPVKILILVDVRM